MEKALDFQASTWRRGCHRCGRARAYHATIIACCSTSGASSAMVWHVTCARMAGHVATIGRFALKPALYPTPMALLGCGWQTHTSWWASRRTWSRLPLAPRIKALLRCGGFYFIFIYSINFDHPLTFNRCESMKFAAVDTC